MSYSTSFALGEKENPFLGLCCLSGVSSGPCRVHGQGLLEGRLQAGPGALGGPGLVPWVPVDPPPPEEGPLEVRAPGAFTFAKPLGTFWGMEVGG